MTLVFTVYYFPFQSNRDEAASVGGQTQSARVPDGDLRFEQELQFAESEIKVSLQTTSI